MSVDKWSGQFGTEYTNRNNPDVIARLELFDELLSNLSAHKFLEVGCNKGHNLNAVFDSCIEFPECGSIIGVDINKEALEIAKETGHLVLKASAYDLPFLDNYFDLVFTAGVLIHLDDYLKAMQEIYRVSKRYILTIEYFEPEYTKINYRDDVLLQAAPWDKLWLGNFTNLKVVKQGNMKDFGINDGTDFSRTCKYVLLEKI